MTGRVNRRRTKIVCTIGPASSSLAMIERLVRAGMDCARLNFSHGTPEEHLQVVNNVRAVSKRTGRLVAVLQDLPGPKLRVGTLKKGSLQLKTGSTVTLTTGADTGDGMIPVESESLPRYVEVGGRILLSDGAMALRIIGKTESTIICKCEAGGALLSGKGVNIPDLKEEFETFTDQDRKFLAFGLEHGVDLVAVSFVRKASDIAAVRAFAQKRGGAPPLVAKIEKKEAFDNISAIAATADAVMVARGDLGVENPIEDVPQMQKSIIATSRRRGIPVITATQMLESMVENPTPTRAEVTDVANAILDGTDAVMLSEETAVGKNPVECVGVLDRVALKTEEKMLEGPAWNLGEVKSQGLTDAFSQSAWGLAEDIGARVVAIPSGNEAIISKISRFRSAALIVHMSDDEAQLRRSKIIWGVYPCTTESRISDGAFESRFRRLLDEGFVEEGERVVFVHDMKRSATHERLSLTAVVGSGRTVGRGRA